MAGAVQRYPVRPSHRVRLAPAELARILTEVFGSARPVGDAVETEYGALVRLAARADGKELAVEVTMNPKVPNDVAAETVARYNRFLESATGYSAKERAKRLRKSAGGPSTGD